MMENDRWHRGMREPSSSPVATHEVMALASIAELHERIRQSLMNMERFKNDVGSSEQRTIHFQASLLKKIIEIGVLFGPK
jgi:hypothetical protein